MGPIFYCQNNILDEKAEINLVKKNGTIQAKSNQSTLVLQSLLHEVQIANEGIL